MVDVGNVLGIVDNSKSNALRSYFGFKVNFDAIMLPYLGGQRNGE